MNKKFGNGDERTSASRGLLMYSASAIWHSSQALTWERLRLTSLDWQRRESRTKFIESCLDEVRVNFA